MCVGHVSCERIFHRCSCCVSRVKHLPCEEYGAVKGKMNSSAFFLDLASTQQSIAQSGAGFNLSSLVTVLLTFCVWYLRKNAVRVARGKGHFKCVGVMAVYDPSVLGAVKDASTIVDVVESGGFEKVVSMKISTTTFESVADLVRTIDSFIRENQVDYLILHFATHGTRVGTDEAICLSSTLKMLDDQLRWNYIFWFWHRQLRLITTIADTCHSGSVADLPYRLTASGRKIPTGEAAIENLTQRVIALGAVSEFETTAGGVNGGDFTNRLKVHSRSSLFELAKEKVAHVTLSHYDIDPHECYLSA